MVAFAGAEHHAAALAGPAGEEPVAGGALDGLLVEHKTLDWSLAGCWAGWKRQSETDGLCGVAGGC